MGWIIEGPWGTKDGVIWSADMSDLCGSKWGKFPNGDPLVLEVLQEWRDRDNDISHWSGILHDGTDITIWND